jgi:drug/metabolite transporter (DMT)-like permease
MSSERRMGLFWVILAASGYAFLPIFTHYIYDNSTLRPTDIGIWRFIFATPLIWLVIWWREHSAEKAKNSGDSPSHILRLMSLGILYAGAALAAFFGLQFIPASIFGIIFYTYPAFVALIAVFLGQRLALAAWFALGITLIGVLLTVPDLSVAGDNTLLGVFIAILNALFVAVYFTLVSKLMKNSSSVMRGSAYVITGTLVVLLLAIPFFGLRIPENQMTWLNVLGLATVSTAMPIAVINLGIHKIGAAQASIISTFEPVLTMILALLLLGESILPMQWLGAAFIIGGVIFLESRSRPKAIALSDSN